jgi:hypothetical protein
MKKKKWMVCLRVQQVESRSQFNLKIANLSRECGHEEDESEVKMILTGEEASDSFVANVELEQ